MNIPMVDLKTQYRQLKSEIDGAVLDALESCQFILGPNVSSLEKEAADYLGVPYAVSVASGTDALHLALLAAGVGPGDEVITTPFTFIATAEAICYVGAVPVFVDVDPKSFNIVPELIEKAITSRTKAVLPVHLFGLPADMDAITDICSRHGLILVEDCAQSFGASVSGRKTGGLGAFGAFSFFPSKNLGGYGDGGMVTCLTADGADKLKMLRNHGSTVRYHHDCVGFNSRLDDIQAAILRVKLKHLDRFNSERRRVAHRYSEALSGIVHTPFEDGKGLHVYHQYTLLTDRRELVMSSLAERGIASAIYYPIPLHRQNVFAEQFRAISLPVAESIASCCISLPIYPEMTNDQVDHVLSVIREALK